MASSEGWVCPKCGRVYSMLVLECKHCNQKVENRDPRDQQVPRPEDRPDYNQ